VLFSLVIGVIIAGLAFATVAGSIALLVKNAAALKTELFTDIEQRNTRAVTLKTDFSDK
jgi:hypothetical protein